MLGEALWLADSRVRLHCTTLISRKKVSLLPSQMCGLPIEIFFEILYNKDVKQKGIKDASLWAGILFNDSIIQDGNEFTWASKFSIHPLQMYRPISIFSTESPPYFEGAVPPTDQDPEVHYREAPRGTRRNRWDS